MSYPTPEIPGLAGQVADLIRRVRDLETSAGAQPGATSMTAPAYPYSDGDMTRQWAGCSATDWRTLYQWWSRMEWATLDVALDVALTGDRGGQLRVLCDGGVLWTSDVFTGSVTVMASISLAALLATPGIAGSQRRFTVEGQCVGGTSGAVYAVPERLLFRSARFT